MIKRKMVIKIIIFSIFFSYLSTGLVKSQDFSSPVGYWEVFDDKTHKIKSIAKLYLKEGRLFGRLVKLFPEPGEDPNPVCDKCKGKFKDQPIIGMEFMSNFKGNDGEWKDGKILDPENGKIYHCQLEIMENGQRLEVFGYIRVIVKIGRNQVWKRTTRDKYPDISD